MNIPEGSIYHTLLNVHLKMRRKKKCIHCYKCNYNIVYYCKKYKIKKKDKNPHNTHMTVLHYSEKQSPAYQLLYECSHPFDTFRFSHSKRTIYDCLSVVSLKKSLMATIKNNLWNRKQELLWLYFSFSKLCNKFCHTVLIKKYLRGGKL